MSRKIQTFSSIITQPMNVHNFHVSIPGFEDYALIVQSTTFPSEQMRMTNLYVQGEEVRYAVTPSNAGTWSVNVPETDSGLIRSTLDSLKSAMWDQKSGNLSVSAAQWFDITVTARDLNSEPSFQCILHGCWIVGRGDVNLSQQDPTANWRWDYQFRYNWLEDVALR